MADIFQIFQKNSGKQLGETIWCSNIIRPFTVIWVWFPIQPIIPVTSLREIIIIQPDYVFKIHIPISSNFFIFQKKRLTIPQYEPFSTTDQDLMYIYHLKSLKLPETPSTTATAWPTPQPRLIFLAAAAAVAPPTAPTLALPVRSRPSQPSDINGREKSGNQGVLPVITRSQGFQDFNRLGIAESDYGVELWFQAPEQLVAKPNHSKFQYPWFWSIVTPKNRGKVIEQEFTTFYLFGGCHTLKSPGDPAAAAAAALLFLSVL